MTLSILVLRGVRLLFWCMAGVHEDRVTKRYFTELGYYIAKNNGRKKCENNGTKATIKVVEETKGKKIADCDC